METPQLLGRLLLKFDTDAAAVPDDLSAAARAPDGSVWVASDEHGVLHRLSPEEPRVFSHQQRHDVAALLGVKTGDEMDIEALDMQDGHLWLVGSHSAVRKKPKGKGVAKDLARLATVEHQPARFMLARLPLPTFDAPRSKKKGAAKLEPSGTGNALVDMLRDDEHLGPFLVPAGKGAPPGALAIPSKDNGLDIEGLAVHGDRVFLGLRGPVLRGWAVMLEVEVEEAGGGFLQPKRKKKGGGYRKHFLDLDGLGIRELSRHGDDLLILAGPTLPLDGTIRLYRLRGGLHLTEDSIHKQAPGDLEPLFDIPRTEKTDHAEGVALFSYFEKDDSVLIVYDSPSPQRRYGPCGVLADVFRLF
ncbi:DUF3616 domain-containing protein [Pyxidicoccus fallax]|uniref:DUF3616 domain-containing protein n=1 Tax=Pyxidicoccus fallax TaxID=394095 RepID=A0A848LCV0_9BACT|nr:DUF3616 domain-containing protein [Pyxidicoccus fallax]NMO16507.1 DUF3616 domain-containing protein [Pyxidicoccus fallax]NPC77431.1 DUF3616 domain-containing protein [Pyxidicoccus fallax]